MFGSLRNNIGIAETRLVPISIRAISMHKIESGEISNRKYLSKTILACRELQAKKVIMLCRGPILLHCFLGLFCHFSGVADDCLFTIVTGARVWQVREKSTSD